MGPYDLNFRPSTYWETPDALLANIKGERRRRVIKELLDAGKVDELERWILAESLTEEERVALGRLHPALMGGEYLPEYQGEEVEIARVSLRSTTGDVIAIRARRERRAIRYRIVDEYASEIQCLPAETSEPLSFGELVRLIDSARYASSDQVGLTSAFRDGNLSEDTDPRELVDFVTISSVFYRELEAYYREDAQRWLAEKRSQRGSTGSGAGTGGREALRHSLAEGRLPGWRSWRGFDVLATGGLALVAAGVAVEMFQGVHLGRALIFIIALAILTVINLRTMLIPDRITLPLIVVGVVTSVFDTAPTLAESLVGVVGGGGLAYVLGVATRGIGGGVIKMVAMKGAFLGWKLLIVAGVMGAIGGGVTVQILMLLPGGQRRRSVQVAPGLSAGAAVSLLWGERIIRWYLGS